MHSIILILASQVNAVDETKKIILQFISHLITLIISSKQSEHGYMNTCFVIGMCSLKVPETHSRMNWHVFNVISHHTLALAVFGIGMKTDLSQSCGDRWVLQICWHTEWSTLTASSFRILKSSTGIPSPPLALLITKDLAPFPDT